MKPNRKIFRKLIFLFFLISTSCKSFASELNTWPDETKEVMHHSVDKTGLWILGAGVLATVTAFQFDESTRNSWRDHQLMPAETSKVGEFWGQGIPEVLIIGSQLYFEPAQGLPSAEGLLLGNLAVQVLKYSIGRERPDHSEKVSMPSGHTQSSFSLATSMTESYGWKVGLPFWGMGVFTGLSRIADDKHWLSDVVAGAAIGIMFGRAGFYSRPIEPTILFQSGRFDGFALNYRVGL